MIPGGGLYAIVDTTALDARGIDVLAFAERILRAKPAVLQLRAKNRSDDETLLLLRALGPQAAAAGVPFFANDRPDLAHRAGVPGVHVGQGDLPFSAVKEAYPSLLVGVSTHTPEQLRAATADRASLPDYVAYGPVFLTSSKADPDPVVGLEALSAAVVHAQGLPIVGIGGIDEARASAVAATGALVAVIGALLPSNASDLSTAESAARRLVALVLQAL